MVFIDRFYRRFFGAVAIALVALTGPAHAADDSGEASQKTIAREMVRVLKAYATYKTGNFEEAFSRYLELAEAGSVQGMLNVANMYAAGEGTPRNHEKALQWYRRAADTGDANAMFQVAQAYDQGLGTAAAPATAEDWYRRAAEHDNAEAQWVLGSRLYERGQRLAGLEWIRTAARDGNDPEAQAFLSARGEGQDEEDDTALGATQRNAVLKTLAAVDDAAKAENASGIVAQISREAEIRVRLPSGSGWTTLSRGQLKTLWQDTFDRAEQYDYARSEPQMLAADGGILAFSRINERFGTGEGSRSLEIHENALLEMTDDGAVIRKLRLDIRDPGR